METPNFIRAQTPTNDPAQEQFPSAASTHRWKPSKDIQSPRTGTPAIDDPEREIVIAVMGVTGTGKSYFIKEASGISDVKVSGGLHSCTAEVRPYSFPYANAKITLVDTPGFNDTSKSDTDVLKEICAWMSSDYRKGKLLSGIIYLHRITDVRIDGSSIRYAKMFQGLCGPNAMKNVLLTTTHWSNVAQAQGERRERELQGGNFWGGLIAEGAAVERFMGTRESGLGLIDKLMRNKPKRLEIQGEMVEQGMALAETNAGKFMNEELAYVHMKHRKDLDDLRSQLLKAVRERDDLLQEVLAEQQAQSQRKLEEATAEKKFLEDMRVEMMKKHEEYINKREEERRRNDGAVIAVASKDISAVVLPKYRLTSYPTIGRFIYDTDDEREFEKHPFNIEIRNKSNPIMTPTETAAELIDTGLSVSNYIIYNQGYYQCKPSRSIKRGSQNFVIFEKY